MRLIKRLLVSCLLVCGLACSSKLLCAQPSNTTVQTPIKQTLQARYPNYQKLKTLREDREFRYGVDVRPSVSFWEQLLYKINRFFNRIYAAKSYNSFWKYVTYAFAIGTVIFVILNLLKVDFVGLFGRKAESVPIPFETHRENIHEINFPALIEEAENQGDYRRAIRLHYLHILKNLTDKDLINWNPAKTNRSYAKELGTTPLRQPFENITQLFEYVWYGGFALDKNHFQTVRLAFQEFNQTLKLRG